MTKITTATRLDRFAELLSQDLPIHVISRRMGMSRDNARKLLAELQAIYSW